MGAGSSKPADASRHVFASDTPVQFSQELIDSLQASSETNSSRAKTLELHIAERVAAELEKLQSREAENLAAVRAQLSSEDSSSPSPQSSSPETDPSTKSTTSKIKSALPDITNPLLPPSVKQSRADEKSRQAQSSQKVQEEIAHLKRTLSERKVLKDLPPDVERARNAVVACLRVNDRRPLDCWKEVEAFRGVVRRMEDKFVADVL